MIERILTVGGFTLLSRATGFARDIILAAVLGAGPVADAFFVALRLPNHFRAIFAEGAFNAAFDFDNNNTVSNADYFQFRNRFAKQFTY